ncbi:MAG: Maf family protein [Desulfurivibrio sp.]|nr:Maf family protein [Desulfurivibrio sp.]
MFQNRQPLVLASASPRRRELLAGLGLEFTVRPAAIDETPAPGELPPPFVGRLAAAKARAVAGQLPVAKSAAAWVLAADTVVVLGREIMGKPRDREEAAEMLARLGNSSHRVLTAYCLHCRLTAAEEAAVVSTEVDFGPLSPELIAAYVASGEPLDKAGAYGIQGLGGVLVRQLRGSYSNVVGLPLNEVVAALLAHRVIAPRP